MTDIAGALKELFALIRVSVDPDKRKQAYKLHLQKRTKIALEMAEKFFLIFKEYKILREGKEKQRLLRSLEYYMSKFFQYD